MSTDRPLQTAVDGAELPLEQHRMPRGSLAPTSGSLLPPAAPALSRPLANDQPQAGVIISGDSASSDQGIGTSFDLSLA